MYPHGRKLPAWTPGALINVHVGPGLVRQYSLCGDPRDRRRYLIAVQRCSPSRGGSQAMQEALQDGDRMQLGLPRNLFPLAQGVQHTLLLAGGIGITPLLAMAEALSAAGASFELHYCARTSGQAAFLDRLAAPRFQGRVQLHFSSGVQRVDLDGLLSAPSTGTHLYICGSGAFTDAAIAAAARQGGAADVVSTERFAPAPGCAAGRAIAAEPARGRAFDVVIASTGRFVHVPAERSAVDALLGAGIVIPTSRGHGICGTCITGVLEGEPDHRDHCLSPEAREANDCFTPCCSRARGQTLILDL
ncbi:PDR/VanB family oxidoreductase [Pseudoduganella sp. UC29_106]|uniref:PDR/VanB family oxidoreductase n=1 Tax=Pseudoduganella sp. UC29_106 TaxID=3374553 RepID=UPI003757BCAC